MFCSDDSSGEEENCLVVNFNFSFILVKLFCLPSQLNVSFEKLRLIVTYLYLYLDFLPLSMIMSKAKSSWYIFKKIQHSTIAIIIIERNFIYQKRECVLWTTRIKNKNCISSVNNSIYFMFFVVKTKSFLVIPMPTFKFF